MYRGAVGVCACRSAERIQPDRTLHLGGGARDVFRVH